MPIARSKFFLRTALLALAVPALSLPSTFTVTGPTVSLGGSSGPSTFTGTSGDFAASVVYGSSYDASGTSISANPTVTYTGTTPLATATTITLSLTESYFSAAPGTWDSPPDYTEHIPFNISGSAAGTTATGQLFYFTDADPAHPQGIGAITATDNGFTDQSKAASLTGLTGDTLTGDFEFSYTFAAGTTDGAFISSSAASTTTPEPTEALPMGLGLAGLMYAVARRKGLKKSA